MFQSQKHGLSIRCGQKEEGALTCVVVSLEDSETRSVVHIKSDASVHHLCGS